MTDNTLLANVMRRFLTGDAGAPPYVSLTLSATNPIGDTLLIDGTVALTPAEARVIQKIAASL